MINETEGMHDHCHVQPFKRICWTAIFVGALIGVGLGFLLNLFGMAIGLSAFSAGPNGASILAIGGLIGIIIGIIASMFVAGYAAGYLGRFYCPLRNLGIIYGFTTWSVALILSGILGAQMSAYLSTYSNNVTSSVVVIPTNTGTADSSKVVAVKTVPAATGNNQPAVSVTAPTKSLAGGAFLLFVLFFIGAFSSCVGACCGMSCKRED